MPLTPQNTPTLRNVFLAFSKIGLSSFGGGLSGWMLREFVQRRAWLSEEEFLNGLALAQAFPGVNVVNLAIWIGYQLLGGAGALAAASGIVLPPMGLALLVASAMRSLAQVHGVHLVLAGVAAAAVGLSLQTGLRAARHVAKKGGLPCAILACTFAAIFWGRLPLLWVVGTMIPFSVGLAWWRLRYSSSAETAR